MVTEEEETHSPVGLPGRCCPGLALEGVALVQAKVVGLEVASPSQAKEGVEGGHLHQAEVVEEEEEGGHLHQAEVVEEEEEEGYLHQAEVVEEEEEEGYLHQAEVVVEEEEEGYLHQAEVVVEEEEEGYLHQAEVVVEEEYLHQAKVGGEEEEEGYLHQAEVVEEEEEGYPLQAKVGEVVVVLPQAEVVLGVGVAFPGQAEEEVGEGHQPQVKVVAVVEEEVGCPNLAEGL
ncbi:formin-2 [Grus japonensis]|uniref:Formin-2 n=1 Tax=Grus japonensis TaxID=30415 RepID=A0ABC9WPK6_GRUJA